MRAFSLSVFFLLCAGFVALVGCKSQTSTPNSKAKSSLGIVGDYFEAGGYGGPGIKLLPNGQYVFSISSDTEATKESGGDYAITDGLLVLSHHNQRYLPVKWGNRMYLLEQGQDELRFCNAINLGDEPVPAKLTFMHPFMMRTGDEKKPVAGKPQLPASWKAYILSKPVIGKVIRVQDGTPYSTITINIGSANNIRVGMDLVDSRHDNTFSIASVTVDEATFKVGGIPPIHTGDIVSTHRTRSLWR